MTPSFGIVGGAMLPFLGDPAGQARLVEQYGFDSITSGGHTHIPVQRRPGLFAVPEAMVKSMASAFDQFVCLTAAAVATNRIDVGTGVILIPEHHPITMAKAVASVDQVSNGRLFLGIGAGWNEEVEDHGVPFAERWAVTRERIEAMRTIWRDPQPEFHGKYVDFAPMYCEPKTVRPEGPPILMGSNSRQAIRRTVAYCDGWMPNVSDVEAFGAGIQMLREEAESKGRAFADLRIEPFVPVPEPKLLERLIALGATRLHLSGAIPTEPGGLEPELARLAEMVRSFR